MVAGAQRQVVRVAVAQQVPRPLRQAPLRVETRVALELTWIEGRIEYWIRFGRQAGERILDRRRGPQRAVVESLG